MGSQSRPGSRGNVWGTLFAIFALLFCAIGATAHATAPGAVKRLHVPTRSSLRILPRFHKQNGQAKRSNLVPNPEDLRHDDTIMLSVSLPSLLQTQVHLLVSQNEHFFHPNAKLSFQNGESVPLLPQDYKLYEGDVIRGSWVDRAWEYVRVGYPLPPKATLGSATVMVHAIENGNVKWEGTFTVEGKTYNVRTRENYDAVKSSQDIEVGEIEGGMVVFGSSDMVHDKRSISDTCGLDKLSYNTDSLYRRNTLPRLLPRADTGGEDGTDNYEDDIGNTAPCGNEKKILYMGIMLDCTYVGAFPTSEAARTNILNMFTKVSNVYLNTFGIKLGIIELKVQDPKCSGSNVDNMDWNVDCESKTSMDSRLAAFSRWRGNYPNKDAGLWHLMTKCKDGSEVGVAWLDAICQTDVGHQGENYVSGTGVSSQGQTEWNVIAHEVGHGFGAIHDCNSQLCQEKQNCCPLSKGTCDAGGQFIMNPTTGDKETEFSECTKGNICKVISSKHRPCLVSLSSNNKQLIDMNQCGNGIVEEGEECDPGNNGTSSCCINCKLAKGAECDSSNGACCNGETCKFVPQGHPCRPAIDKTCDVEEVCAGATAVCPKDVTTKDGTSCGDGLTCASGHCTSRDAQCQSAGLNLKPQLKKACTGNKGDKSCSVSCQDPDQSDMCTHLQQNWVDGTSCGYGGHCYNSTCKAGPWTDQLSAMYTQNLQIAIPVTVAVGLIILAVIYQLIRCCYVRRPGQTKKSHGPRAVTNARGGRTPPSNPLNAYQPISEPLLTTGGTHGPPDTRQPGHVRDGSLSSDEMQGAAGAGASGMPMPQMYQDPYAHHPDPGNYGGPNAYGDYNQQPAGNYNQQPAHGWVDERDFNGPSYQRH